MTRMKMPLERISRKDIESYKREIMEQSVLVSIDDAAQILSVSKSTVRRNIDNGKLIAYNDNPQRRGLRILAADLKEYVRSIKIDRDFWQE